MQDGLLIPIILMPCSAFFMLICFCYTRYRIHQRYRNYQTNQRLHDEAHNRGNRAHMHEYSELRTQGDLHTGNLIHHNQGYNNYFPDPDPFVPDSHHHAHHDGHHHHHDTHHNHHDTHHNHHDTHHNHHDTHHHHDTTPSYDPGPSYNAPSYDPGPSYNAPSYDPGPSYNAPSYDPGPSSSNDF
jgi:hypothetical protein